MISIVTVNWHSYDWAKLLIESAQRTSSEEHEIVVVDNTPTSTFSANGRHSLLDFNLVINEGEPSHGEGLNLGVKHAQGDHVLILDVDCHFLSTGWENLFRKALNESYYCITVAGSEAKPIRPACLFMQTQHAKQYDWRATPGYKGHRITPDGFDVGIIAYNRMVENKRPIYWMEKCDMGLSRYGTLTGEEYGLYHTPIVYHHWHGTHLRERNKVDYIEYDLMSEKEKLFKQIPWKKKAKML